MRVVDDLVVEFDKEKSLASAEAVRRTFEKVGASIKAFSVTIHHSVDVTRKFHEAMDTIDSFDAKADGGKG